MKEWQIRIVPDAVYRYLRIEFQKLNEYWLAKGAQTAPECTECAEFIAKLCKFEALKTIKDPDQFLNKMYEPHLFPPIANYRLLSLHSWCAIFRLDTATMEIEPVLACRCSDLPTVGLLEFIERNGIRS